MSPIQALLWAALAGMPHHPDAPRIVEAIATVATEDEPLPGKSPEETAVYMLVNAYYESSLNPRAKGDGGKAHCAFQVHAHGELADPKECARVGLRMMRHSWGACDEPLAMYISGRCDVPIARLRSAIRVRRAEEIIANAARPLVPRGCRLQ